jgi:hypothetical protein
LPSKGLNLSQTVPYSLDDVKLTLVFVRFDKVVETFPQGFEHKTLVLSFSVFMREVPKREMTEVCLLFEVDYVFLCTVFLLDIQDDVSLNFCTLVVAIHCSNDLNLKFEKVHTLTA